MVRLDFTLRSFPATGAVKDATGLPFSCVVQPFSKLPAASAAGLSAQTPAFMEVLRCSKCYGYINCHCSFQPPMWQCSLCNHANDIKHMWSRRYNQGLEHLPELRGDVFEMIMDEAGPFPANDQGFAAGPAPILLALVDLTGSDDWLDLVRSALQAALEAVPPYTLFGLITFSNKIGLHDVRGDVPSVRTVELREGNTQPIAIPCAQVMPIQSLLAPVGKFKDNITLALEALRGEDTGGGEDAGASGAPSSQTDAAAVHQNGGVHSDAANSARPGGLQQPGMQRSGQQTGRGLGPVLLGLIEYLQAVMRPPFRPTAEQIRSSSTTAAQQSESLPPAQSPVRLMTFLAGPPDWGVGRLVDPKLHPQQPTRVPLPVSTPPGAMPPPAANGGAAGSVPPGLTTSLAAMGLSPDDSWLQDVSTSTAQFYEQAAVAAAALGCCCDLYTISEGAVGLQYLQPLANATGGAMYMYPSIEESALPQDVYRRLTGAHASAGVLRLRCSQAFRPARHYGRLYADQQVENLHHIVSCCDTDTFAVDFELASTAGFTAPGATTPVLQVAFQYTTVVSSAEVPTAAPSNGSSTGSAPAKGTQCVLQRRLRVATYKVPVSGHPLEVMRSCSNEALLVVLLHKISKVAAQQGHSRARVVLRDWLANLATNYHHLVNSAAAAKGHAALLSVPVDVSFSQAETLQSIPRLVYALLRSPLLAPAVESQHPDLVPFMASLWCSLPPAELQRAVYPALSSYADPDTLVLSRHSLSRGALLADGAPPIFVLDAYVLLVVLYTSCGPPGLPCPPPPTSALRKMLATVRQERRITPQLRFVRETDEGAALFFHLLLDEPDDVKPNGSRGGEPERSPESSSGGSAATSAQYGLVQFLEHIRLEVVSALRAEAQAAARP